MTDKPRRIAIIGNGIGARAMKIILQQHLINVEVENIKIEDVKVRRKDSEDMIILDSQEYEFSTSDIVDSVNTVVKEMNRKDVDWAEERRYQKPPRLRGAAEHKRRARKARNKGKHK